jgi:hypothetical protein
MKRICKMDIICYRCKCGFDKCNTKFSADYDICTIITQFMRGFDLLAEIFSFDFILFFDKSSYDKTADDVAITIVIEYYGEHLDGIYRKN